VYIVCISDKKIRVTIISYILEWLAMNNESYNCNFVEHLSQFIGETVTIYTTSGGLSGQGVTGVVLGVNDCFVRLITAIGPAPTNTLLGANTYSSRGCRRRCRRSRGFSSVSGSSCFNDFSGLGGFGNCCRTGAVTDIPIDRIAQFVHSAV